MKSSLSRRLVAEFVGTGFLVAAVVGSGIMAERLANGNVALALLANTIATGAVLVALILTFGPISGAHFNPVVTLADAMEGGLPWSHGSAYVIAQILGGLAGTVTAHLMFGLPSISISHHVRSGSSQLLSEFVATFGLLSRHLGMLAASFERRTICGRSLHNRCLLVYRVYVVRKSRSYHCEVAERYLCRHSPQRRSAIRCRAGFWSVRCDTALSVAGA